MLVASCGRSGATRAARWVSKGWTASETFHHSSFPIRGGLGTAYRRAGEGGISHEKAMRLGRAGIAPRKVLNTSPVANQSTMVRGVLRALNKRAAEAQEFPSLSIRRATANRPASSGAGSTRRRRNQCARHHPRTKERAPSNTCKCAHESPPTGRGDRFHTGGRQGARMAQDPRRHQRWEAADRSYKPDGSYRNTTHRHSTKG